ncbi:MAG TPA: FHA domain-containing protein [Gemmataceae bacterium]|nr:FHA domain-containing protein [Gemmataceae bacterium]
MTARLIERGSNADDTREFPLTQAEFLIGRGTDCDLRLHGAEVSRHHCLLRLGAGEATLVDLGSSNGTYLNGRRVRSQAALNSGDELRIGDHRFVVDLDDGAWLGPGAVAGKEAEAPTLKLHGRKEEEGHPPGGAGGPGEPGDLGSG